MRVARRLAQLPQVAEAFGDGRLSYSQVRAITRAGEGEDERELLRVALTSTTAQLERHVRQLRSSASADLDAANARHARRFVTWFWDEDGMLKFFGRLGSVDGAVFVEAIETGAQAIDGEDGGPRPALAARRADALTDLALGGGIRTHLVLHADPEALACQARGEQPRAGEMCALRDGPAIPSEIARRLTCDADISLPGLNLGRTVRTITPAQRRALEARDGRVCAMPGCDRTHGLDGHHIRALVARRADRPRQPGPALPLPPPPLPRRRLHAAPAPGRWPHHQGPDRPPALQPPHPRLTGPGGSRMTGSVATFERVRIATWNVNSVKQRMPRLLPWLDERQPDVVCLQETKLADEAFGELLRDELEQRGYEYAAHGEAAWNGVAILSRAGLEDIERGLPGGPGFPHPEARAVAATCGGLRVHSIYVPNGRSPGSDHYQYKLAWLARLREIVAEGPRDVIVAGDVNVAPADADVFDPDAYIGETHVTEPERAAVAELLAGGLRDVVRDRWPDERVFTYWDYRAGMFHQDCGMRIDLVLAGEPVAARVQAAWVDRHARKGKGPSDHAPVIVDLDEAPDGDIGPVVPPPSAPARRGTKKLPQARSS